MTSAIHDLRSLCLLLASSIVGNPEALRVRVEDVSGGPLLVLRTTDHGDYGKLLGRAGGNLRALRALVDYAAARRKTAVRMLLDALPANPHYQANHFRPKLNWNTADNDRLAGVVRDALVLATLAPVRVEHRNLASNATALAVRSELDDEGRAALEILARAIGMNRGRVVFIDAQ